MDSKIIAAANALETAIAERDEKIKELVAEMQRRRLDVENESAAVISRLRANYLTLAGK